MAQQQRIGRYEILERMAAGGQATVYRARDVNLGRVVALKVLFPQLASDPQFVERFMREARMAASISHPNVVTVYEVGQDSGQYFMAMEFMPSSLDTVLTERGSLPVSESLAFARQVASALGVAHEHGIVHRDIKPQNVLIAGDGSARVADFGIARASEFSVMTRTGQVMGTPHYMSPEQARGERVDIRSDIYALGIMLYQMLAGELPFHADTPLAVLRQHTDVPPPPLSKARPDVPPGVAAIVARCLEKDAATRY